jgi:tripartite ATP-independent transporter DctP family solute receptor
MKRDSLFFIFFSVTTVSAAFLVASAHRSANDTRFTHEMIVATFHPRTGSEEVEGLYYFKDLLEKRTDGKIKVDVFYGGTLGGERELVEQLKLGVTHLCLGGWTSRGLYIKDIIPWGVPYLFSSREQVIKTIESRIGEEVRQRYAENGIEWLGVYFRGNRQLTTNRLVRIPDDLRGMSIRLPENPDWIHVWQAYHCIPTPIPSPEIFGSLQMGVVEAQENPISANYNRRLWEVQKYTILTNHIVDIESYLLSRKFIESLDSDLQEVVRQTAEDAMTWCTDYAHQREAKLIAQMQEKGMQFVEPDLTPFKEIALTTFAEFRSRWRPWVYDETVKCIEQ